jgi:hypothetical protein
MSKLRFSLNILAVTAFLLTVTSMASAQATRTWVSGVGDDVNPCSRTAPCKTFAGAISKTAAGGEIDALDPGGFGTVTATKSITFDGGTGSGWASVLSSATSGITVNDSATSPGTSIVIIRNISINGAGTPSGNIGVRIISGKHVSVENCQIFGFLATAAGNGRGISDTRTIAGGTLVVVDSLIENCFNNGIAVLGPLVATIDNVRLNRTTQAATGAVVADSGAKVTIRNSTVTHNTGIALFAGTAGSELNVENCVASFNNIGIQAGGGTVRVSNTQVTNCTTGIGAGTVKTFQNNKVDGNTGGNAFAPGSQINPI